MLARIPDGKRTHGFYRSRVRRRHLRRELSSRLGLSLAAAALFVLPASFVRADPLAEVRSALAGVDGHEPVCVTLEVRVWVTGASQPELREGRVSLRAEHGPDGRRVTYPRPLLDRIAEEEKTAGDDPSALPASEVLQEVDAIGLGQSLSFASPLGQLIKDGTLLEAKAAEGESNGKLVIRADPARLDDPPYTKESELVVTLWLGPDGVPVAADTARKGEGRIALPQCYQRRARTPRAGSRQRAPGRNAKPRGAASLRARTVVRQDGGDRV